MITIDRQHPQPGERYRHFKGNEYNVIAIAHLFTSPHNPVPAILKSRVVYSRELTNLAVGQEYLVFDTESSQTFTLTQHGANPEQALFMLVPCGAKWREEDVSGETIWARPLTNFMEILSSGEGEAVSNYYRFEKV